MSKKEIFEELTMSDRWTKYFKQYAYGNTVIEQLVHWISQVNQMTDNVNDWNTYLHKFVETFDEKLKPHVIAFLQEMYDSGDLRIIMEEFISNKAVEIDETLDEFDKNLKEVNDFNKEFFKETKDLLAYTKNEDLVYSNHGDNYKITTNSIGNFDIETLIPDNEMLIQLRVAVDKPVKIRFTVNKNIPDDVVVNFRYMHRVENIGVIVKDNSKEYEVELTPPPTPTTHINIKIDKVSVLNFTNVKAYQDLELNVNMDNIMNSVSKVDTINNTVSTINNVIDVIRTWDMNVDNLTYYNNYSCMDYESKVFNGKIPLDCSSFVLALLKGVKYQYQNIITGMDNAYSNYAEENINPLKVRYTFQLAKYADDHGYSYIPNEDFSNAKPGDLLFWSSPYDPPKDQYKEIQHVAMFLGMNSKGQALLSHYYQGATQCVEIRDGAYTKGFILGARFKLQDTNAPILNEPTLVKKLDGRVHTLPTDVVELLGYQELKANTPYTIIFRNYKQTQNENTYPIYTLYHGDGIYKNISEPTGTVYMSEFGYTNPQTRDKIVHFYFSNRFKDGSYFRVQPARGLIGSISYDSIEVYDRYIL